MLFYLVLWVWNQFPNIIKVSKENLVRRENRRFSRCDRKYFEFWDNKTQKTEVSDVARNSFQEKVTGNLSHELPSRAVSNGLSKNRKIAFSSRFNLVSGFPNKQRQSKERNTHLNPDFTSKTKMYNSKINGAFNFWQILKKLRYCHFWSKCGYKTSGCRIWWECQKETSVIFL
jgi:hypothetical protein